MDYDGGSSALNERLSSHLKRRRQHSFEVVSEVHQSIDVNQFTVFILRQQSRSSPPFPAFHLPFRSSYSSWHAMQHNGNLCVQEAISQGVFSPERTGDGCFHFVVFFFRECATIHASPNLVCPSAHLSLCTMLTHEQLVCPSVLIE